MTSSTATLRLCDGGLLPMLWADTALRGAAAENAGPLATRRSGCIAAARPSGARAAALPFGRVVCPVQLPIPPPAQV